MRVTFFGTTTLLFDDGKDQLLFDCHFTRPSLWNYLFGKLSSDPSICDHLIHDFQIHHLRGIFISHSHHDHVLDCSYVSNRSGACIYGSPSALNVARGGSVPEEKLFSFRDHMAFRIGDFLIQILPSLHSKPHWYNHDLGQTIDSPVMQPARRRAFKEGGSFDFYLIHQNRRFLIRPSYQFLEGELDGYSTDVLFQGIAGLSRDSKERQRQFFSETVGKTVPKQVVPLHWDDFFSPLSRPIRSLPLAADNIPLSFSILERYCSLYHSSVLFMQPLSSFDF